MSAADDKKSIAGAYAHSLLDLATEQKTADPIGQELRDIRKIIESDPMFRIFLSDPAIGHSTRSDVLKRAFDHKLSPLMNSFIHVANDRDAAALLPEISEAYDALLDELSGKVEVDVTVAQRLSPEALENVRSQVSLSLKRDAVMHQTVDESIIGGMVLQIGDQLIDGSVKAQLDGMRHRMLAAKPQ